ncbi:MAG: CHAT domain-containing protein [Aureispira sp.]|nr:CHAT domain-containing protein [Aureispira sp.]
MPKQLYLKIYFLSYFSLITNLLIAQNINSKLSYTELDSIITIHFDNWEHDLALPYIQKGIAQAAMEYGKEDSTYAHYLYRLGDAYHWLEEYEEAEKAYVQSIDLYNNIFGMVHNNTAMAIESLGVLYFDIEKYEKAEKLYLKTLKLRGILTGKQSSSYSTALSNLALLHEMLEDYDQAEALYLQVVAIDKKNLNKTPENYAIALNNLAVLYYKTDKYEEAEPLFLQSKSIRKNDIEDNPLDYAESLNNLASLYLDLAKYRAAEKYYIQAKEIIKEQLGKESSWYSVLLNNLAELYQEKKDYEQAETLFTEAIQIRKKVFGEKHLSTARALNNLTNIYEVQKDYEQAKIIYEQATSIRKEILGESGVVYANSLSNLASLYNTMGQLDTAYHLSLASLASNANLSKTDLKTLANADYLSPHQAYKSFNRLLKITKEQVLKVKNKKALEQHYAIVKTALQANTKIRTNFTGKQNQLRVLSNHSTFVEYGINAALALNSVQYKEEAFSFAEQNKSILLEDAIKGSRAKKLSNLPDSLALKELVLQAHKDELKKALHEAKTRTEKTPLLEEENQLNTEIGVFIELLKQEYPKYYQLKYQNITAKAKEIQSLLDKETLLLEYFTTDSTTYLFALSTSGIEVYPLPISRKLLDKQTRVLRKALTNYSMLSTAPDKVYQNYTQAAYWFYQKLLASALENTSNITKLVIITDGNLGHLPFETFLQKQAPQKNLGYKNLTYLLNDYTVNYNYSATLWKESKESAKPTNNHQLFAFAAEYGSTSDSITAKLRSPYLGTLRQQLQPLPAAQKEVEELEKLFEGAFKFGDDANEAFFKQEASQYGIIHLAMHGLLHGSLPILSSLAFTENNDSIEDNFLQAYEISRMQLNADLVVLSACETGYGKFEQGEGIVSLARSFMYAGVPALIVSLWSVNDDATSRIMQAFYKNLSAGVSKPEALRQAKLDYIQKGKGIAGHPAFWSPFIQLGDESPVQLQMKADPIWFWLKLGTGLLVLVIVLLVGIKWRKNRLQKQEL